MVYSWKFSSKLKYAIIYNYLSFCNPKKAIKSQYELLNLKVSCFLWITTRETIINNKVFRLTAKFPIINHRGKL